MNPDVTSKAVGVLEQHPAHLDTDHELCHTPLKGPKAAGTAAIMKYGGAGLGSRTMYGVR
jgi:hypothetical protein